jgi:hypothetical protein
MLSHDCCCESQTKETVGEMLYSALDARGRVDPGTERAGTSRPKLLALHPGKMSANRDSTGCPWNE